MTEPEAGPKGIMRRVTQKDIDEFKGSLLLIKSDTVPDDGEMYYGNIDGEQFIVCGPLTHWTLAHAGRRPFYSEYCVGSAESRRERRLRAREPKPPVVTLKYGSVILEDEAFHHPDMAV